MTGDEPVALEWLYTMRRPAAERVIPPVFVRRAAAVTAVGLYPISMAVVNTDLDLLARLGTVAQVLIAVLLVGIWAISAGVVSEFRRRLAHSKDEQLDERERAVRDAAYLISYRILGGVLTVLAIVVLIVVPMFLDSRMVSLDLVLSTFFSLVVAATILPSAVVAWRDTDAGDLGEGDGAQDPALPTGATR